MCRGKIFVIVLLTLFVLGCTRKQGPESTLPPVITLDSPTGIYNVKAGRQLTISPTYKNVSEESVFVWLRDGQVIGRDSILTYSSDNPESFFLLLQVSNKYGQDEEEIRINVISLDKPVISLPGADKGFVILTDTKVTFSPSVKTSLETKYEWKIDGVISGNEKELSFSSSEKGIRKFSFTAENEDGKDELIFDVTISSADEIPINWSFESTEYNVSLGRTIRLRPDDITNDFNAEYVWWADGVERQRSVSPEYHFTSETEGKHIVKVQANNKHFILEQELLINVCPKEGTFYRAAKTGSASKYKKVYSYIPAPGQFINEYFDVFTYEDACAYAQEMMDQQAYVSLGGFGGYIVVGFDHSIDNDGGYNIAVTGNSFEGSSEPGILWVMQDENGDGLPNDTWYELKGSEYGLECTTQDYAVTYYRPSGPKMDVQWTDNKGNSGCVDYLGMFHTQDYYYPNWIEEDTYTLRGTCLEARNYDQSGTGTYWINPSYGWGYADNFSSIDRLTGDDNYSAGPNDNHFKISDAVTFDGKEANLKYIDFIKIQNGLNTKSGWLGEVSTEVFGVFDFNMIK